MSPVRIVFKFQVIYQIAIYIEWQTSVGIVDGENDVRVKIMVIQAI
jgi:hypothetical protein